MYLGVVEGMKGETERKVYLGVVEGMKGETERKVYLGVVEGMKGETERKVYLGVVEGMKGETERKQVGFCCEDVVIHINDHVVFLRKEQIQVLEGLRHHVRVHPVNNSSIQKHITSFI